ncbi:MAG TPA: SprT family zinc-dependent metalloprotease [Ottowia sp.]|nr:SprT family zinc-dependent metalloprotease [Ottowia sp.]HRQ03116.1 SprT family zinc-dependent metalloprotease [Ottowia sp.]
MHGVLQLVLDLFGDAAPAAPGRPAGRLPAAPGYGSGSAATPATAPPVEPPTGAAAPEPVLVLPQALTPARFSHPRANREIALGRAQVAYEFRRGQRRTIGFTIGADGLVVSAPRWTSLTEVEAALRAKEGWIVAKLDQARIRQARLESARIEWREGAGIPFLGEELILVLDPRQRHGRGGAVLAAAADALPGVPRQALHVGLPQDATPEQLRDTCQAWLMRQARRIFTARLDHFAPQLDVRWQRLGLSSAGTRWGSASADGSIRLNWRLVHFSQPVIDYVVVHELAHLREMNHSPRFWQHVQAVLPDYAERRSTLREQLLPRW